MNLIEKFPESIELFIKAANKHHLKMILVGGGAVNFLGYNVIQLISIFGLIFRKRI